MSVEHKYGTLTTPLGVDKHSFAQLVTDNPNYASLDIPTNPLYSPTIFSKGDTEAQTRKGTQYI